MLGQKIGHYVKLKEKLVNTGGHMKVYQNIHLHQIMDKFETGPYGGLFNLSMLECYHNVCFDDM